MENMTTQVVAMEMGGTEGARRVTGVTPMLSEPHAPDPEVPEDKARRRQRDDGQLQGLSPKKRGRKASGVNPLAQRVAELEREIQHLRNKLKKAELIIEFQKKISEILGIPQDQNEGRNS